MSRAGSSVDTDPELSLVRGRAESGTLNLCDKLPFRTKGRRMPWFPEFVHATELIRRQNRIAGRAELHAYFQPWLRRGGIELQLCALTDDGAARIYDDAEPPDPPPAD
jgi:hypothetical protein